MQYNPIKGIGICSPMKASVLIVIFLRKNLQKKQRSDFIGKCRIDAVSKLCDIASYDIEKASGCSNS